MSDIKSLKPENVWKFFSDILQIPRPSKKEGKIIEYLENFALENNLDFKKDDVGNILIKKPASNGNELLRTVILQSHVDMVCEKNSDVNHDFENDPINAYIENDWIKAKGTTLGADNGIGVAFQLAILENKHLEHGPLECLFTVDEETGLTGANRLSNDFLTGGILINLDSEDEGEIFIGCAGGIDTLVSFPLKYKKPPKNHTFFEIKVSGLKGGHSGDDINKGLGNSNKILTRLLWSLKKEFDIKVANFQGGNLRNAIPREAFAVISFDISNEKEILKIVSSMSGIIKHELKHTEPDLTISINTTKKQRSVLKDKNAYNLLNAIYACPNGIIAMSNSIPGLVETSTNLASIHFKDDETAEIVTSQRSSVETAKVDVANSIVSTFNLIEAKCKHTDSYPGWLPNTESEILKVATKSYKELFSKEPKIKAIHAGLECGLFLEKYPFLDMISIGPTMRGVHSPDERLNIKSVESTWNFLLKILKDIPNE